MSSETVAFKKFKPGVLVRTRHRIGIVNLEEGAEGHVQRVDESGYVYVEWPDKSIKRGIHYEHLTLVAARHLKVVP